MKAAIVGASGLVGSHLIKLLSDDPAFSGIVSFARSSAEINLPKVTTLVGDLHSEEFYSELKGYDVAYCCIGTTIRKAGSQDAFLKVDYNIPLQLAVTCEKYKVPKLIIISSLGAKAASSNFYLHVKGAMERDVTEKFSGRLHFLRPSFLLGERKETRIGEMIVKNVFKVLKFLIPGKYRPIHAKTVAKAMVSLAKEEHHLLIIENQINFLASR